MSKTYHPHIKVNVTQEEKDRIDELARKSNISSSAFVKRQIATFLQEDIDVIDTPYEYEVAGRNHVVRVPVSQNELEIIKEKAGNRTIAAYMRDVGLNGSKVLRIEVYDDDIVDLMHRIQPQIDSIFGIVRALKIQKRLNDAQYLRLENLLESIASDIRGTVSIVRKNRTSIRQTRLRELRRRCKASIETGKDSLAVFEENEEEML